MSNQPSIHIIGAGVSGLAAAITLKNAGYKATILEASDHIGGRVASTTKDDNIYDHGFQVMLDAYPAVAEFLDTSSLELQKFVPGSMIFKDGISHKIGDPRRDFDFAIPTLVSGIGSLRDKWLVFTLSRKLTQKSIDDIFTTTEQTTLEYLKDYGFSDQIINQFFKPFYTGIFLEPELATSSRMFEFVFKMFTEGNATLPAAGIQAIPQQMAARLDGVVQLNTAVDQVVNDQIIFKDGSQLHSDYTIIATEAESLVPNLPQSDREWHSVQTLYFATEVIGFKQAIIGLIAGENCLSNNFHFLNDCFPNHDKVVSVTVVKKHDLSLDQLAQQVRTELVQQANIELGKLLHDVTIHKALPQLDSLQYCMNDTETQLTEHIYLAGDHLSNGSLNAAMLNGKAAANAVIAKIENHQIV